MPFVLVGLSHKTAPVDIREKAFIPEAAVGECVRRLIDHEVIDSGVMLSTCNRTELYALAASPAAEDRVLGSFAWWPHELPFESWRRYAYQLVDDAALSHLFRVAAGLDSMVMGEGQILGQLKRAGEAAQQAGVLDPTLQIILRGALRAGKRVRHETSLGRRAVSVSHAAVVQAKETLSDLRGRGVLLVGAGVMSEVALQLFQNQGVQSIFVASRTLERADRVARPAGAVPVEFSGLESMIERVDIIISSSSAPYHLFDVARVEALQRRRGNRPLLVLDIAVPRDVDPAVAGVPGVHLFNIDDLRAAAERNLDERQAAIPEAEEIIAAELDRLKAALQAREAAPLVTALVARVERLRDEELKQALARVPPAETRTRDAMRGLADSLTARFLHGPVRHLRGSQDPRLEGAVLRDAFELPTEDAPDQ